MLNRNKNNFQNGEKNESDSISISAKEAIFVSDQQEVRF